MLFKALAHQDFIVLAFLHHDDQDLLGSLAYRQKFPERRTVLVAQIDYLNVQDLLCH